MRPASHRGFTLLELVISCAILVTIFALATTALTRVHRLRADSESQTRLMTEGRALLDDIANQLAYVADTNIWISGQGVAADGQALSLIRYAVHPQSRKSGDAYADTPYYALRLDLTPRKDGSSHASAERIARSQTPEDPLLDAKGPDRITFGTVKRDSLSVTNAYAADEMGTHIPAAAAGDTISVPVTTGSSVATYGARTSFTGHVNVLTSPFEGTNTVIADVVFESAHSGERTLYIRKPVTGRWPSPSTCTFCLSAIAEVDADNITSNAFLTPGHLDYTNAPLTTVLFSDAETNATAQTVLTAILSDDQSAATNDQPVATNDLPVATNAAPILTNDVPIVRTAVSGELLYGPLNTPFTISNYWTWGKAPPIATNGILSGISLVIGGRTNSYASAVDVAASATSTVTRADANFELAELLDLLTLDLDEGRNAFGSLSNIVALTPRVAYTNEYAPRNTSGEAFPLYVSEIMSYEERATPTDFTSAFSVQSAAAGTGTNATPLLGQSYRREMELVVERDITASNATIRVVHDWRTETHYNLLYDLPDSIASTNSVISGGTVTNVYPCGTSYDTETNWRNIVLDENFDGADERTTGIWLREEGNRNRTELLVHTNSTSRPYARSRDATTGVTEETLSPAIWDSLQAVIITPLCFSTNEDERLSLMVWDPTDDPPGPPVCADIYLELLAPAHQRRAQRLPAGEKRTQYIQNHVVRLARRALIGTARRELP